MRQWLIAAAEPAIVIIDGFAFLVIAFGTLQAFAYTVRTVLATTESDPERREAWLRYGRWLVAGLTFQLAADIIETSITTSWEAIGRIAAIAFVRTFLNYFLERDISEIRARQEIEKVRT